MLDDDEVAVEDAGLDHRVTFDPQHEDLAAADKRSREGENLFDFFRGEDRGAGGDATQDRYLPDLGILRPLIEMRTEHLDCPWLGWIPAQVTRLHQRREMAVHGRRRRQPDRLTDFADRRWIAPFGDGLADEDREPGCWRSLRVGLGATLCSFRVVSPRIEPRSTKSKHLFDLTDANTCSLESRTRVRILSHPPDTLTKGPNQGLEIGGST